MKKQEKYLNHHIHSTGSDGKAKPEEIVLEAIRKGFSFICFTDHNKNEDPNSWGHAFFSEDYVKEVLRLKKEFKDKIQIGFGIEIDWREGGEKNIIKKIKSYPLDFVLGSVHYVRSYDGSDLKINFNKERILQEINKIGINSIIRDYYKQIQLLAKSKLVDCIAHLDVFKTFNKNNCLFDESSEFYKEQVLETLKVIKENNVCMEINTSGNIYDCNAMFPSEWILKEAHKLGIPITIGADTHWIERIDDGIKEAYKLAKKVGYKEILIFKNRKPVKIKI